jgi:hypothetical protein
LEELESFKGIAFKMPLKKQGLRVRSRPKKNGFQQIGRWDLFR